MRITDFDQKLMESISTVFGLRYVHTDIHCVIHKVCVVWGQWCVDTFPAWRCEMMPLLAMSASAKVVFPVQGD